MAWRHSLPTQADVNGYKRELLSSFIADKIDSELKIKRGLERARKISAEKDFLISAANFAKCCQPQPEDFGLLEPKEAYLSACKSLTSKKWEHETISKAAQKTGIFELKTSTAKEVELVFIRNYQTVCERYMNGERFAITEERQLEELVKPLSKDENLSRMAELKRVTGL